MKKILKQFRQKWHNDINININKLHDSLISGAIKVINSNQKQINYAESNFFFLLIDEILRNITNQYDDNYDYFRFGEQSKNNINSNILKLNIDQYRSSLYSLLPYLSGLTNLYLLLADEQSKFLLIQLITYKILGYEKYKLPLSTPDYWNNLNNYEKYRISSDFISVKFPGIENYKIYKHDLNDINIPINIYLSSRAIYSHMHINQYEYIDKDVNISIFPEDVVLDCGACFGDTALFFANKLNKQGHVYSFEFIPDNIAVFNKNIEINPHLKERITLVPNPLDEYSNKELYYVDNGPGSKVSHEPIDNSNTVFTIDIDSFFDKYNLKKIDFIKMDIEGAELPALKGALKTLKRFKPKLAISIYHSMNDFVNIAPFLDSLNLGYQFYLKHGTIHNEETVLLAIAE